MNAVQPSSENPENVIPINAVQFPLAGVSVEEKRKVIEQAARQSLKMDTHGGIETAPIH